MDDSNHAKKEYLKDGEVDVDQERDDKDVWRRTYTD